MPDNRQIEILNDLLKTAERDFDATVKHAAAIEDKAQKTSGLAGLFLAAAFGFIKPDSLIALQRQYGNISVSLLYLALACFVISIGLCVRAMWLRKVPASGVSLASQEMPAQLLLQLPAHDLDDEVILAYKTNQVRIWSSAIDERFATNTDKTKLVHYAQRALSAGILVVNCEPGASRICGIIETGQSYAGKYEHSRKLRTTRIRKSLEASQIQAWKNPPGSSGRTEEQRFYRVANPAPLSGEVSFGSPARRSRALDA